MKIFQIRIFLNGRYYVRRVSAVNSDTAVELLKEKLGTKKEYRIVSVKEASIAKKADMRFGKKLYVAYGSNLHLAQMAQRCPDAKVYGSGVINNYRLAFYHVASILPEAGAAVPVGVWAVSAQDERNLDRYEGFPHLYRKETIEVVMDNGEVVAAMVYIMNRDGAESHPDRSYYGTIYSGYCSFGLNTEYLENAVKNIPAHDYRFSGIR